MAIVYDVFSGNATGGPVDYTAPVLSTSSFSATLPALAAGSVTRFGVRARDTVTGLSDNNTDAQVVVTLGPDGTDCTNAPPPVQAVSAYAGPAGSVVVEWAWPYRTPAPTGFRVYTGTGTPSYATPALTVSHAAAATGRFTFRAVLTGLTAGSDYAIGVRAYNGAGEELNTDATTATPSVASAVTVAGLTAAAGY